MFASTQAQLSLLVATALQSSWLGGVLSTKAPNTSPPSVADASATPPGQEGEHTLRKNAQSSIVDRVLQSQTPQSPPVPGGGGPSEPPPVDPVASLWPEGQPPEEVSLPILEEAAERVARAEAMTTEEFFFLGHKSREAAFTITSDMGPESIRKIQSILADNMASGADREVFLRDVGRAFDSGMPISEAHLEQVFRNAVNSAWSDGAEASLQQELVVDEFPYRQYFATTDERVRDEHLALETLGLNGTGIYRADDPVWRLFRPPWSWNCRCAWTPLSVPMAAADGVKEAQEWLQRARKLKQDTGATMQQALVREAPVAPEHVPAPPFMPDPQWIRSESLV